MTTKPSRSEYYSKSRIQILSQHTLRQSQVKQPTGFNYCDFPLYVSFFHSTEELKLSCLSELHWKNHESLCITSTMNERMLGVSNGLEHYRDKIAGFCVRPIKHVRGRLCRIPAVKFQWSHMVIVYFNLRHRFELLTVLLLNIHKI